MSRTADEIRKTAPVWAELRQWAHHESDEGLNIKRRDDKGEPDYWVFLGDEGEWEQQVEFAREVAKTFGIPLIVITWDDENEDVEVVDYDPPSRAAAIEEAVKPWREALAKVVAENCEACGQHYPICQMHMNCDATFPARALLDKAGS